MSPVSARAPDPGKIRTGCNGYMVTDDNINGYTANPYVFSFPDLNSGSAVAPSEDLGTKLNS